MVVMTMTEARAALPQVLDRVASGEEVTITRRGKPVAVVMRPDVIHTASEAQITLDEDRFHAAARRRGAAGKRIIGAAPMDVDDVLAELDEMRSRRA